MLREGKASFRSSAKFAGLSYVEMIDEAARVGITVDYTLSDLKLDLAILKKER